MESHKWKASIDADTAAGNKIGARGTPTMFINGKVFVGAQPFESFKQKIDEEIKNADALIAKGTPAPKVYDKIMASAKAELPAAPAGGARRAGGTGERSAPVATPPGPTFMASVARAVAGGRHWFWLQDW